MIDLNKNVQNLVDLTQYQEVCDVCGAPARTELNQQTYDPLMGVGWFQFCINYKCIQFDAGNLRKKRERLEQMMRESKPWRRNRAKQWKREIVAFKERQRQRWAELFEG